MKVLFNKLLSFFLYFLLAYPIFYFVYKYGDVRINGLNDYLEYYKLYKDFSIFEMDNAYLPRIFSAFLVFALSKLGLYYDVVIAQQLEGYDQSVYFNAILINFIGAIGTSLVLQKIAYNHTKNFLISHIPGILYFLSYGILAWGAYALIDGFATFLFVIAYYFYTKKTPWIYSVLFLSVFQRDLILVSIGAIAFFDSLKSYFELKNIKIFSISVFFSSVIFFILIFILKITIFKTESIYYSNSLSDYLNIFYQPRYTHGTFLRAIFFSQNMLLIYVLVSIWFRLNFYRALNNLNLLRILFVIGIITAMSFMVKVPLEIGRYSSIFLPLIPLFLVLDLSDHSKLLIKP